MKKIITLTLLLALTVTGQAQFTNVDTTTVRVVTTTSAARITIPGVTTNAPYTTTNTSAMTVGDPALMAFAKINANFAWLANWLATNPPPPGLSNYWLNGVVDGLSTDNNFTVQGAAVILALAQASALTNTTLLNLITNVAAAGGITNVVPTNAVLPSILNRTLFFPTNSAGGGGSGNYIVVTNGTGTDLTITNSFTLVSTNISGWQLSALTVSDVAVTNANGNYFLDPVLGALTNSAGYALLMVTDTNGVVLTTNGITPSPQTVLSQYVTSIWVTNGIGAGTYLPDATGLIFTNAPAVNTNLLILSGAGSGSVNGVYVWTNGVSDGLATNYYKNASGSTIEYAYGYWLVGDYYHSASLPSGWVADVSPPAPLGKFATNQLWAAYTDSAWRFCAATNVVFSNGVAYVTGAYAQLFYVTNVPVPPSTNLYTANNSNAVSFALAPTNFVPTGYVPTFGLVLSAPSTNFDWVIFQPSYPATNGGSITFSNYTAVSYRTNGALQWLNGTTATNHYVSLQPHCGGGNYLLGGCAVYVYPGVTNAACGNPCLPPPHPIIPEGRTTY